MRQYSGFRHIPRDWRRVLRATGAGTVTSAAPINMGQTFTISCMVYLARYGTAVNIWLVTGSGGLRFTISATGLLTLNNAVDTAVQSSEAVPLCRWVKVETTFDAATRLVRHLIDGEVVHSAVMAGSTAWTHGTVVTTGGPIGTRFTRLQSWRRVLTQAESRADFYSWTGPTPDVYFGLRNASPSITTVPGTDGGVALGNSTVANMVWTDDVPGAWIRGPRPWGYSFFAAATPDGTSTIENDTRTLIGTSAMAALRSANKIVLGHWIKFLGATQTQTFRSMYLELPGAVVGPSLRFDCTTAAGEFRLSHSGRITRNADAVTTIPASSPLNLRHDTLHRWRHVAVIFDYVNSTVQFALDGIALADPEAFSPSGTYNSAGPDGTERVMAGCLLGAVTGGLIVRTLQADHIVCAQASSVDTLAELRSLVVTGAAPTGTLYRATLTEGSGVTSVDAASGATIQLTRDGGNSGGLSVAAGANWRPDVP